MFSYLETLMLSMHGTALHMIHLNHKEHATIKTFILVLVGLHFLCPGVVFIKSSGASFVYRKWQTRNTVKQIIQRLLDTIGLSQSD
jgi:hypothetical protein